MITICLEGKRGLRDEDDIIRNITKMKKEKETRLSREKKKEDSFEKKTRQLQLRP